MLRLAGRREYVSNYVHGARREFSQRASNCPLASSSRLSGSTLVRSHRPIVRNPSKAPLPDRPMRAVPRWIHRRRCRRRTLCPHPARRLPHRPSESAPSSALRVNCRPAVCGRRQAMTSGSRFKCRGCWPPRAEAPKGNPAPRVLLGVEPKRGGGQSMDQDRHWVNAPGSQRLRGRS